MSAAGGSVCHRGGGHRPQTVPVCSCEGLSVLGHTVLESCHSDGPAAGSDCCPPSLLPVVCVAWARPALPCPGPGHSAAMLNVPILGAWPEGTHGAVTPAASLGQAVSPGLCTASVWRECWPHTRGGRGPSRRQRPREAQTVPRTWRVLRRKATLGVPLEHLFW